MGQRAAAAPLSPAASQRLSQALVRHQILAHLRPGPNRGGDGTDTLKHGRFLGLFAGWEMEQVSAIHTSVSSVRGAWDMAMLEPELLLEDGRRAVYLREGGDPCLRRVLDLHGVRRDLLLADASDSVLLFRMGIRIQREKPLLYCGALEVLVASHHFHGNEDWHILQPGFVPPPLTGQEREAIEARSSLYLLEDAAAALVAGTSADEPPFGWVDALQGLDCRRWGRDRPRCAPNDATDQQHHRVLQHLSEWRWQGFVFWGKGRVDLLKERHHSRYRTGWLMDMWD